ncbi:hypothetical protein RB595_001616 [Gaeumannomyces hyphopodioides]
MTKNNPFTPTSSSYADPDWMTGPDRSMPAETEPKDRVQASQKLDEDYDSLADAPRTEPSGDRESAAGPRGRRFPVLSEWTWEFVALGLAAGAVVGMFIVLGYFHENRVPEWRVRGISIGAIVSILSLVFRAALGFIIAEIAGQAKWSWFGQTRPLYDLFAFDQGGRGVFGPARLFKALLLAPGGRRSPSRWWESPGGRLGVAVALVTLLSFAVGPFAQQAVGIVSCRIPVEGPGLLPAVNFVPKSAREAEVWRPKEGHQIETDLKNAIFNGFGNRGGSGSTIKPSCTTGNCVFPEFASIGVCSKCVDVSKFIEVSIDSSSPSARNGSFPMTDTSNLGGYSARRNFSLPTTFASIFPYQSIPFTYSGAVLSLVTDRPGMSSRGPKPWADEFGKLGNYSLADVTVLTVSDAPCTTDEATGALHCPGNITSSVLEKDYSPSTSAVAADCRLYTCLRKYQSKVVSGTLIESLSDTIPALPEESYFRYLRDVSENPTQYRPDKVFNFTALREPCTVRGSDVLYSRADFDKVPPREGRTFATFEFADGQSVRAPSDCIYKMTSNYHEALALYLRDQLPGVCNVQNELRCASSWWLAPLYAGRNASFASISASVANFSSALSDSMRLTGAGPDAPRREDPQAPFVRGAVLESTLCIRFIWPWLLLPAVLTVATAAMLAAMVAQGYLEPGQPTWKSSILPLLLYGLRGPGDGDSGKDDDGGGGGGGDSRRPELLGLKGVEGISKMVPARFDRDERAFVTAAEWPEVGTEPADRGGRVRVKRLSQDSLLQSR